MSALMAASLKPRTVFCRRRALMEWTGWNEDEVAEFVRDRKLIIHKQHTNSYPRYLVESAQEIIDEIKRGTSRRSS